MDEISVKAGPLLGGFPEVVLRPRGRELWFASYLQTYIERDVRLITTGCSFGAFHSVLFTLKHPKQFRMALAMSGWLLAGSMYCLYWSALI